ncbi:unnamed protein product [Paramecium sonneborni]|uniref:Transmembrane protein n=1 Tax=Paramecium sonneborni TaxID=65129 RepID=A0A8S1NVZ6_9CILI|nr:unnamed protein product [Paramecium sonneborni]
MYLHNLQFQLHLLHQVKQIKPQLNYEHPIHFHMNHMPTQSLFKTLKLLSFMIAAFTLLTTFIYKNSLFETIDKVNKLDQPILINVDNKQVITLRLDKRKCKLQQIFGSQQQSILWEKDVVTIKLKNDQQIKKYLISILFIQPSYIFIPYKINRQQNIFNCGNKKVFQIFCNNIQLFQIAMHFQIQCQRIFFTQVFFIIAYHKWFCIIYKFILSVDTSLKGMQILNIKEDWTFFNRISSDCILYVIDFWIYNLPQLKRYYDS